MNRKLRRTNCSACGISLTHSNSVYIKSGKYLRDKCRSCYNRMHREYRDSHPEYAKKNNQRNDELSIKKRRDYKLKINYGISPERYEEILKSQFGACAICKKLYNSNEYLGVDHDHATNEVRGLLCRDCNASLGNLKEDENLFWNAMEYLKKYKWSKLKLVVNQ